MTFAYPKVEGAPSPLVLHEVSLTIAPAGHVAVIGASGAGKSTIATLIAGIHDPCHGRISRPDHTVLLSQETHVFSDSLAENLRFANPTASDNDLVATLSSVGAGRLLGMLPDGLNTVLGRGGHPLSPAQEQHIALARLMLADPDLAILDEATAEVDSTDAHQLDRAARAATKGRTSLVISHRLSQARACDRIIVLHESCVVESGTHDELLARRGHYAQLWRAWTK